MPKSTAAIGNYLAHLFQNAAWANIGDAPGLLASSTAGSLYVSLHTANPGISGNQSTSEAAYSGYTRKSVARNNTQWTVSAPQVTNANAVVFPACASGSETEAFWGLGTDSTGAGNLLYFGPLAAKMVVFTAETTDDITVPNQAFSVDDRVVFYNGTADDTFPAGLTVGTVYFVKTSSGDVITVSTTSGGTVVDITAAGAGICAKVVLFAVSSGTVPSISSGNLVILEN